MDATTQPVAPTAPVIESAVPPKATAGLKLTAFKIESDGTKDGTKITLNGKAIANMSSLNFSFWPNSNYQPISLGFCVRDPEAKAGELNSYTSYNYSCPSPPSCYAANKATASVEPDKVFEVKSSAWDPQAPDRQERRSAYARL